MYLPVASFMRLLYNLLIKLFFIISDSSDMVKNSQMILKGPEKVFTLGERTFIMGVLNITPDSFSDGGSFLLPDKAIDKALELSSGGADIIDVGGESSRPGAEPVELEEELKRVVPVVAHLARAGLTVSVDTTKAGVARAALDAGAWMINDISALGDAGMASVINEYGAALTIMHMRGTPASMQRSVIYTDIIGEISGFLSERLDYALENGIPEESIAVDPGLGFGKSAEGNFAIIKHLGRFNSLGRPLLIGPSRKSFIGSVTGASPLDRLPGTLSALAFCVMGGAHIVRVHDVRAATQAIKVAEEIKKAH